MSFPGRVPAITNHSSRHVQHSDISQGERAAMNLWQLYMAAIIVLIGIGIYCLLTRRNIIQLLIGIEVIAKGVTLSFILAGFFQGNEQIAQAIVITIILIEVITMAVAMSLAVMVHRHTGSLDIKDLRRLRG